MKIKRFLAGMAAGVLAAAAMAVSVSAASTKLGDVLDPNAEVAEGEDNPFYKVGGMTFFMNGSFDSWNDNSGTWFGIDEEGTIEAEYKISKAIADPNIDGTGSLGMMGLMICNLPEDKFPYLVNVKEVSFTDADGKVTDLDSIEGLREFDNYVDQGKASNTARIIIRPQVEKTADETGINTHVTKEVVGWDEPGKFEGGTLKIVVNLLDVDGEVVTPEWGDDLVKKPEEESKADESKADESKAEDSKADESKASATTTGTTTAVTQTAPAASSDNSATGAADGIALAAAALGAAGAVVVRKRK